MKTNELMQELLQTSTEKEIMDNIAEKSLQLSLSIQKFKKINRDGGYIEYNQTYEKVCEKIAEMRLALQKAEYLFNKNSIDVHYDSIIQNISKFLNN